MLRVMTLNVWNLDGPWRERRVEIVGWLSRVDADLICLQEIVEGADGQNQAQWLAEEVGAYSVAYGGRDVGGGILVGNAVLSRWPIESSADVDLPSTPATEGEVPRVAVHARTGGVDVYSTHLNFRYEDGVIREAQVQVLADFVHETADPASEMPPVIGGDFNAEPDSTEMRFLLGLTSLDGRSVYFQDAWRVGGGRGPGYTWDNRNTFAQAEHEPDRRIDYVLVGWRRPGGAGRVESAAVVCDRALTGTFASDHFGVVADLVSP